MIKRLTKSTKLGKILLLKGGPMTHPNPFDQDMKELQKSYNAVARKVNLALFRSGNTNAVLRECYEDMKKLRVVIERVDIDHKEEGTCLNRTCT